MKTLRRSFALVVAATLCTTGAPALGAGHHRPTICLDGGGPGGGIERPVTPPVCGRTDAGPDEPAVRGAPTGRMPIDAHV